MQLPRISVESVSFFSGLLFLPLFLASSSHSFRFISIDFILSFRLIDCFFNSFSFFFPFFPIKEKQARWGATEVQSQAAKIWSKQNPRKKLSTKNLFLVANGRCVRYRNNHWPNPWLPITWAISSTKLPFWNIF
jgi:hypothetical protein